MKETRLDNRKGFGLIALVAGLVLIGVLIVLWQKQTGGLTGSREKDAPPETSYAKQIINKAKVAATKADTRQTESEKQLKELGL